MNTLEKVYELPTQVRRADGSARFAFVTFLMLNDSYLPGALTLARALQKQRVRADLVCLVTEGVTRDAHRALSQLSEGREYLLYW